MLSLYLAFARNKNGADGKHCKGVDHVQNSCIEDGFMAEDGGNNRVTHKTDISKHQCEANGSLIKFVAGKILGQYKGYASQYDIGDDANQQQWQDILSVGQLACHRRG